VKKNKVKLFIFILLLLIFNNKLVFSKNEIKILLKIDNEIITNIDVENEKKYLIALNNKLNEIPISQLNNIAKESLIKEIVKKNELKKFFDLTKTNEYAEKMAKNFYKRLNFKNEKEFELYLNNFNVKKKFVIEKIKHESLWNQMIYERFRYQINIDEKKLRQILQKKINENEYKNEEYDISEILFELNSNENLDNKLNIIKKTINELGFESTSNIYSISPSSKFGGKIGWIEKNKLSEVLLKEIINLKKNELSKPIQTNNGYLIIRLNDKRVVNKEINFEDELNKLVRFEKDKQYNQISNIFYNKIKQNTYISEK
jgi:peptidyl-prolyl cis-trans isomerase SurA